VGALCLALFCACACDAKAAATTRSDSFEVSRIKAGLERLGIGAGYEIVVADDCAPVENTAAQRMQRYLAKASVQASIVAESQASGAKRILLGRESNLEALRQFEDKGELDIRNVSEEDDGFHLKQIGESFVVAGANPRGVLYGVYAFEDYVNDGANGTLDIKRVPYFRKRTSAPGYYWNSYINMETEDLSEEKVAYFSRLGINQFSAINASMIHLWRLVSSDIFPYQSPPQPELQAKIRAASALCKKYGIDYYVWLEEPVLSGAVEEYPEEALGTVDPPYGDRSRTLCVSSPIVQEHYRSVMRKFVREYPDVKGVNFYNLDSGTWLCTPGLCPRCKKTCTDSPPDKHNPWETQALLVSLLAETARDEKPDFDFRFWGAVHYKSEALDKLLQATQGYGSLLCCWNAWDRDVMVPDIAELDPGFISSQKACAEREIPLLVVWELNNLESVPRSLPFPFHACDALKKFKTWGINSLNENAGPLPEHNSINALVMKAFLWNPDLSPEAFLSDLSVRQFGAQAGDSMYRAWQEIEKAFDVWNDVQFGPLSGSQAYLSIGTPAGLPEVILPEIVESFNYGVEIRINVQPWRASDYEKFRQKPFLDKMELMNAHLAQAAEHAQRAVALASNEDFIEVAYFEGRDGRPTRKEYAELNYAAIAIANGLCTQRCNMLRAYHLLTGLEAARAAGDVQAAQEHEKLYHELIRDDIGVQERFSELLTKFSTMQPCYTRTSLTEQEISDRLAGTRAKIEKLKTFLAAATTVG